MDKLIVFKNAQEIREGVLKGLFLSGNVVGSTMGPAGRYVITSNEFGEQRVSKDGATVAKMFGSYEDGLEKIGVEMIVRISQKMSKTVGDGTTTASVILTALANECSKHLNNDVPSWKIIESLKKGENFIKKQVSVIKKPIDLYSEDANHIARIAANGDSMGHMIAEIYKKVGKDGMIIAEESKTNEDYTKIEEGFMFDKGFAGRSGMFTITEEEKQKNRVIFEDVLIIASEKKITSYYECLEMCKKLMILFDPSGIKKEAALMDKKIIIIASDFEADALTFFSLNRRASLNVICVKAPGFGDRMRETLIDLGIVIGCDPILENSDQSIGDIQLQNIGSAKKVIITSNHTTIINGNVNKSALESRIKTLEFSLNDNNLSSYEKEKTQERLARLKNGIARVFLGGQNEVLVKERTERAADVIGALKSAYQDGVIPGGGVGELSCAWFISEDSDLDPLTKSIFSAALKAPIIQIMKNSGKINADVAISEIYKQFEKGNFHMGYNAKTGEFVNMFQMGILNSASIICEAILLATLECEIFSNLSGFIQLKKKQDSH